MSISYKKSNWLRAAVLGANDGIVSTASIVVGVAGLVAGALSMGVGEYVSVSTLRDTEQALIERERQDLIDNPELELEELVLLCVDKGLSLKTARMVAEEFTAHDGFSTHLDVEFGINPNELTNPWHAAFASSSSFFLVR